MESIIAKLNSDDLPVLIQGLQELKSKPELHAAYLKVSPLANELLLVWELTVKNTEAGPEGKRVEELVLANLTTLLAARSSSSKEEENGEEKTASSSSRVRLAQHVLKADHAPFTRLRYLVERRHKTDHPEANLLAFGLAREIALLSSQLGKEVQHRFDFKNLLTQQLSPAQTVCLARMLAVYLEHQATAPQKRHLLESPLCSYVLDHVQELPVDVLERELLPHLQLSPTVTPALLKCMQFHPDAVAREQVLAVTLTLVKQASRGGSSKAVALVMDLVEPFGDFAHAEVFEAVLASQQQQHGGGGGGGRYVANAIGRKMKLCKFEPRNSFYWFKMVSLLCRFLVRDDGGGEGESGGGGGGSGTAAVDIPEEMLPRQMLVRGLLFNGNALVKLYTLDLLVHLLVALSRLRASSSSSVAASKETLLRRLPEPSLLVSFHAAYVKSKTDQNLMLYLRALRVLELYAQLNVLVKFDPMRFLPPAAAAAEEEEEEDQHPHTSVVWYHVVRLLDATATAAADADLWLKIVDNNTNTVLGKLLRVYYRSKRKTASSSSSSSLFLPQEAEATLEYLLCVALQSVAPKSALLDCVDDVQGKKERVVTQTAKRIVRFASQSEDQLAQVQQAVLRAKKERHAGFDSAAFALPYPNPALLTTAAAAAVSDDAALWAGTRPCDVAEEVAAPLGQLLLLSLRAEEEDEEDSVLHALFSRIVRMFASKPSALASINAVHAMLAPRPAQLPVSWILELNAVLNSLSKNTFPIAQNVLADITHLFQTRVMVVGGGGGGGVDFSPETRAQALCNPLATHEQRLALAQQLLDHQPDDLAAFELLFEYDAELILHPSVFEVVFAKLDVGLLRRAIELFPAQASFLANRFPQSVDQLVRRAAAKQAGKGDDDDDKTGGLVQLRNLYARLPGLCSFALATAGEEGGGGGAFETSSLCLARARTAAAATAQPDQEEEQKSIPCTIEALVGLEQVPQTEAFSTLLLENFDKLGLGEDVTVALSKLKQFTAKRAVSKHAGKQFVRDTLSSTSTTTTSSARIQAVTHLVEIKRIKPSVVLPLLVNWPLLHLHSLPQAELLWHIVRVATQEEEEDLGDVVDWHAVLAAVLPAYHATLGKRDLYLRQVLHVIEQRYVPGALVRHGYSFGAHFVDASKTRASGGTKQDVASAIRACGWVLDSLDGKRLRSSRPDLARSMAPLAAADASDVGGAADGYDPSFMLRALNFTLALHAMEANLPPTAANAKPVVEEEHAAQEDAADDDDESSSSSLFQPKRWILGGQVDYILRHTASADLHVRKESYACLQRFAQLLARAGNVATLNHFRDDVLVLLRALKTGITAKYEQLSPLMMTYACEFMQILCRGSLHNALNYRLVTSFLFSSTDSGWRLGDIPLFYETINSGSVADANAERAFTLNLLARGVSTKQDLAILHKRHCLEILLSVFDSPLMSDLATERTILRLVHQVASIKNGGALEVLRNGFVPVALGVLARVGGGGGDEGDDDAVEELAVRCSEIFKLLAQARVPLFERIKERDEKRLKLDQRVGEQWFPRCEWSCDEAEMQLAARAVCECMLKCGSSGGELFTNLLDVLLAQRGLLRLTCDELVRVVRRSSSVVAVSGGGSTTTTAKLVELIVGSTSLHVTTRQDLEEHAEELFGFVIANHHAATAAAATSSSSKEAFAWLAQVAQLAPEKLPVKALVQCYSSAELEWIPFLNQCCMVALSAAGVDDGGDAKRKKKRFAHVARTKLVPELLQRAFGEEEETNGSVQDLLPVLLYEALTGDEDGAGYYAVAEAAKAAASKI